MRLRPSTLRTLSTYDDKKDKIPFYYQVPSSD